MSVKCPGCNTFYDKQTRYCTRRSACSTSTTAPLSFTDLLSDKSFRSYAIGLICTVGAIIALAYMVHGVQKSGGELPEAFMNQQLLIASGATLLSLIGSYALTRPLTTEKADFTTITQKKSFLYIIPEKYPNFSKTLRFFSHVVVPSFLCVAIYAFVLTTLTKAGVISLVRYQSISTNWLPYTSTCLAAGLVGVLLQYAKKDSCEKALDKSQKRV